MIAKYFNSWEFKQALDLTETDPLKARILYEEYIQKYPKDYSAYPFYCSVLITLGDLDTAEKILNYVKNKSREDKNFSKFSKIDIFNENILFDEIKLLCYQKRYRKLYKILRSNLKRFENRDLNSVMFFVEKQLGYLDETKREVNSYLFRQITKYKEEDFLDHIQKHLSDNDGSVHNLSSCVFVPGFPIKEVIEEIKKYIPSNKALLQGFYDNIYYFKYDGCGRDNNKLVNYIKVVCLDGTQDIITICPVVGGNSLPHIDLNYIIKETENNKIKRISQIDKFNQKYKRN